MVFVSFLYGTKYSILNKLNKSRKSNKGHHTYFTIENHYFKL